MQVKLVVKKGSTQARVIHLQSAETIVGRRHDCDLRILSSEVSRRHCLLSIHKGVLSVEDLDSVNGTHVNGKRVTAKQPLRSGDMLDIGPLRFKVEYEATDKGTPVKPGRPMASETLEVLPVADEEVAASDDDSELDALPVIDDDTQLLRADGSLEKAKENDEDEAIPMADELDDGNWQPSGDLRSILSEIDDKEGKPKRKSK
jgi:pSer/pThr/pTyr-binding forkhead associated (FHA) protein